MDLHEFYIGKSFDAYTYFGAHRTKEGVLFRVFAPSATAVNLIGEFNGWQEAPMRRTEGYGVYELIVPDAEFGQMYKYKVYGANGSVVDHCDPYGFGMQLRPESASYIVDMDHYRFKDYDWMEARDKNYNRALNIYEVHLGSWLRNSESENGWFTYEEMGDLLIPYLKDNGYTHVEMLPVSEHPADESWGYQNTGFFSPTARYGSAESLKKMIDHLHQAGFGVILDFVPVHFALDSYALAWFDGTSLYEYDNEDVGVSEWGTHNFNFARGEVRSFMQSAANYWLNEFHVDGLRMDAISRAIYWMGDARRGVNPRAVEFIRDMNQRLHELHPNAMLMAEDSTDFLKVTAPVDFGGLGFDYKWDMGWMNDTLDYFRTPPEERPQHYHKLTFSMHYFYNELFLLPLSHDECVHGKATIIQKMWGDYEDKFRQCRAFYLYMYAHPGKKLNFMGNEIAQFREWDEKRSQDWELISYPIHDAFHNYMTELNHLYLSLPALYEREYDREYFRWIEVKGEKDSVYAFERGGKEASVVAVFNFSAEEKELYPFYFDEPCKLKEKLNSDWERFSGNTEEKRKYPIASHKESEKRHVVKLNLAPFSGRMFIKLS